MRCVTLPRVDLKGVYDQVEVIQRVRQGPSKWRVLQVQPELKELGTKLLACQRVADFGPWASTSSWVWVNISGREMLQGEKAEG